MTHMFIPIIFIALLMNAYGKSDSDRNEVFPDDILFVSPEMHDFLAEKGYKVRPSEQLMNQLISDLISADGLGFSYNKDATFTASRAFAEKQGNCLSFSFLYAALARELGFKVRFNQARVQKNFLSKKALVVETGHINLIVCIGLEKFVVDLSSSYRSIYTFSQTEIDDHLAFASYYNNMAVDTTADENYLLAEKYFISGLKIAPKHSSLLRNYGLLNRLLGNNDAAEKYLLRSSKESKNKSLIYFILSNFYREIENEKMALKFLKKAKSHRKKNPFYYHAQGMKLAEEENWHEAIKKLKKSIRMAEDCHFLYHDIALIYKRAGETDNMIRAMKTAVSLAPTGEIKQQYQLILREVDDTPLRRKEIGPDIFVSR